MAAYVVVEFFRRSPRQSLNGSVAPCRNALSARLAGAVVRIRDSYRYGLVFNASIADDHRLNTSSVEVPGWLEFIACRCR
jgi:hypothetical protein